MGRRGPAPKPTALKIAAGNPGKRALNSAEPVPPAGAPEPPEFLDERSRRVWDQLVPMLSKTGLARKIDGCALGRYCVSLIMWHDAVDFTRKNGTTYAVRAESTYAEGKEVPGRVLGFREFPQAAQVRKLSQQLLLIEREFGLTPAARTRIQIEADKKAGNDVNELKRQFFASGATTPPPPALVAGAGDKRRA